MHACRKRRRPTIQQAGIGPMKQTWSSPVRKADAPAAPPPESAWRWLLDTAASFEPALRKAFLRALERVRETANLEKLAEALESGNVDTVMDELGLDEALPAELGQAVAPQIEDEVIEVGRGTPARTMGGSVGMRFDLTNPKTAEFLRTYNFDLIKQISDDTREGIRTVVSNAFANGGHPYVQAREIMASIGLTDTQAAAVQNFRNLLVNRDRAALTRALRDKRFDRTLDRGLGALRDHEMAPEQVDKMVARYRDRMIDMRAKTIARTETIRAANAAQHMAWQQAADIGLLDINTLRRFWLVTPDDRLCEVCEAIPEDNPDGVALDEDFDTDLGPVAYPPAHPNCRCATYIKPGNGGGNGPPGDGEEQ